MSVVGGVNMRNKIIKFIITIFLIILLIPSIIYASNFIHAYIVDYTIIYHMPINDKLNYPLLSYEDNTYIAIRDMASILDKNIIWQGEEKKIYFSSKDSSENIIKEEETALAIAEAIAKEYYKDKISSNTEYYVTYAQADGIEPDDLWCVFIKFEFDSNVDKKENIMFEPDVEIDINPLTCNFSILERTSDGNLVRILDFKNLL